jgi:hypothetical protein
MKKKINRPPENMASLSESASVLHAIGIKTLDEAHTRTIQQKEIQIHALSK